MNTLGIIFTVFSIKFQVSVSVRRLCVVRVFNLTPLVFKVHKMLAYDIIKGQVCKWQTFLWTNLVGSKFLRCYNKGDG